MYQGWKKFTREYLLSEAGSIRRRLMNILGTGMLFLLLFVLGSITFFVYRTEGIAWRDRQGAAARNAAQGVDAFIQGATAGLALLGRFDRATLQKQPELVQDLLDHYPALAEVVWLDSQGQTIASFERDRPILAELFSVKQTQWFLDALAGRPYYGNLQILADNDLYLVIALPALPGQVVAARLEMNVLREVVADLRIGKSGSAFVVDAEGRVIAHNDPQVIHASTSLESRPEMAAMMAASAAGWHGEYRNFQGIPVVAATWPVQNTGWLVVTEQPQQEAYGASRLALILLSVSLALFTGVLILLIRYRVERSILRPIEALRAGTERIGRGDLNHRIAVYRHDEIGQVAEAFNQMAASLSERDAQLLANTAALRRAHDELEVRVQERTAELGALFAAMNEVVMVLDRCGQHLKIPSTNAELLYRPQADLLGKTLHEVLPAPQADLLFEQIQRALASRTTVSIDYSLPIHGRERWFAGAISPLGEDRVILVAHDITARKRAEEQLLHDAFHDALTGLPNRALFLDRLGRAIERQRRSPEAVYAVLFLDLDRFKVINDSLGHLAGDSLLMAMARRLAGCLRSADTAARLGGDEFVILLEDLQDGRQALQIAGRLQEALQGPIELEGQKVFVTASIGVVLGMGDPRPYEQPQDVLRDADIALYQAKAQGRACYAVFDASLRTQAIARLALEGELRGALERGEFELYYQPIRSLVTDRVTGFEALLRWHSSTHGVLLPAEFIPVAEETGLIVPIGEWVLGEAARQLKLWQEAFPCDPPLNMNINLSGVQFAHPNLVGGLERLLAETALAPFTLRLEITESVFTDNARYASATLARLDELGIQLQIDDFGTGYSSLAYLQRFPIQTVKIDRTFVERIGAQDGAGDGLEMVRTIVSLAHDLGMEALAEGVETPEQLAQLKALDCQYGQGYLIARPMGGEAANQLLAELFYRPESRQGGGGPPVSPL